MNNKFDSVIKLKEFIKTLGITYSVIYFLCLSFILYDGITNLVHPEDFNQKLQIIIPMTDEILIYLAATYGISKIIVALILIFRLHLKISLVISSAIFVLNSFIYFLVATEVNLKLNYLTPIIVIDEKTINLFFINLLFFIFNILLYQKLNENKTKV